VNAGVFAGALLASAIEVVEMVAIVVAVGAARSWRAALIGAAFGLAVPVVAVAALGPALGHASLGPLRLVVGALLLIFGLGWLRKGILRVAREGWRAGTAVGEAVEGQEAEGRFDWTALLLTFKGIALEGLEVAVIVVALGAAARALGSAILGGAAAIVVVGTLGALTFRLVARIPRRALQLVVGTLLATFGTFWSVEGVGVDWPGGATALAWIGALYLAAAVCLLSRVRSWDAPPRVARGALP
jgi:uncharacterized membrane protein